MKCCEYGTKTPDRDSYLCIGWMFYLQLLEPEEKQFFHFGLLEVCRRESILCLKQKQK
jgi:hypothetical protein